MYTQERAFRLSSSQTSVRVEGRRCRNWLHLFWQALLWAWFKKTHFWVTLCWLTPDPIGDGDGDNPNYYAYVHNNPLFYIDPKETFDIFLYAHA
jgi:hypothetical protein